MTLQHGDRLAILELLPRYAAAIDARRPDDLVELFCDEASFTVHGSIGGMPAVAEGRAAILDRVRDRLSVAAAAQRRHVIANQFIDATGPDAAILHAYLQLCMTSGGVLSVMATGRYASGVVRTTDGWRLREHVLHLDGAVT